MKQQADQHRTEREFEVADWVFVRLQHTSNCHLSNKERIDYLPSFLGHTKLSEILSL